MKKADEFKLTERRLWNSAVQEGLIDRILNSDEQKIRRAFRSIGDIVKIPPDLLSAVSEILSLALAETEARIRVQSAFHRALWSRVLAGLPEEERGRIEHEIRTLTLKDIDL